MDRSAVVIRASKAGTYTTTLSNGQTVRYRDREAFRRLSISRKAKWHLSVEDWQPANPYDTTFGPAAAETRKARIELELDALKAWPEIPRTPKRLRPGDIHDYVDLPAAWTSANGGDAEPGRSLRQLHVDRKWAGTFRLTSLPPRWTSVPI